MNKRQVYVYACFAHFHCFCLLFQANKQPAQTKILLTR